MNLREAAKFASGFAASQALSHGALAAAGAEFAILGITYSPGLNATAAIVWAVLVAGLAYYAWIGGLSAGSAQGRHK